MTTPVARTIEFPPTADKTKLLNLLNHINAYMDADLEPKEVAIIRVTTNREDVASILDKIARSKRIKKNDKGKE